MTDDADVRDRLVRMEGKIDLIGLQHATAERIANDHEDRLRALERWKYALPVTALAAVVTGATTIIAAIKGG